MSDQAKPREFTFYKRIPVGENCFQCLEVDPANWTDPNWTEDPRVLRLIEYAVFAKAVSLIQSVRHGLVGHKGNGELLTEIDNTLKELGVEDE